jgi:hypothetical protein
VYEVLKKHVARMRLVESDSTSAYWTLRDVGVDDRRVESTTERASLLQLAS